MEKFETYDLQRNRFVFSFRSSPNPKHKIVDIQRWKASGIAQGTQYYVVGGSNPGFSYSRTIVDKKVLWTDIPGVATDHTPLEVREYIERVGRLLAFI